MPQKRRLLCILFLQLVSPFDYINPIDTFTCSPQQSSLSFNLNQQDIKFLNSFSLSLWFKYRMANNNQLLSVNFFNNDLNVFIDSNQQVQTSQTKESFTSVQPGQSLRDFLEPTINEFWHYLVFYFSTDRTISQEIQIRIFLNGQSSKNSVRFTLDLKEFFVTLGSSTRNSLCQIDALFYDVLLINNTSPLTEQQMAQLSFGIAEPIFLSKFAYEASYNKLYGNLIPGRGEMRNGLNLDSFTSFSSLSPAQNSLGIRERVSRDNPYSSCPPT